MKKNNKTTRYKTTKKKIILGIIIAAVCLIAASASFLGKSYSALDEASEALNSTETVEINQISKGYFFDGPGEKAALVFYPGAKVEYTAYAPLMRAISETGIDCFLAKMPADLAILDYKRAGDIIENYNYDHWIVGGHSLGGAMAASFAAKHTDEVDGLLLLAAYSISDLSESDIEVLSFVGSNDEVISRKKLAKYASNLPSDFEEVVIDGGNHAYFGDYGEQRGDGTAEISREEQQEIVVEDAREIFEDLL